jgi:hypothetical protein
MGFKVKRTVEVQGTGTLQEFYVRVDKYTVYKNRSCMTILTGHFTSPEGAQSASGEFFNDEHDYTHQIPTSMSIDGTQINYNPRLEVELFTTVENCEPYVSSSILREVVDYIDFNEDGEEVTKQRTTYSVVQTESTTKLRKDLNNITGSIYTFAYDRLKEKYQQDFNPCVIEDIL